MVSSLLIIYDIVFTPASRDHHRDRQTKVHYRVALTRYPIEGEIGADFCLPGQCVEYTWKMSSSHPVWNHMSSGKPIYNYIYAHMRYILPNSFYKHSSIFNIIPDCLLLVKMPKLPTLSATSRTESIDNLSNACGFQTDKVVRNSRCYS